MVFAPLVGVNLWHAVVILTMRTKTGMFASISESALYSQGTLWIHRAVHGFGAGCFILFGVLSSDLLGVLSAVLIAAAVLDVLQVFLLSEQTNHDPLKMRDQHQLAAWAMAAGYMFFSVTYAVYSQVGGAWIAAYLLGLFCVAGWNKRRYFRHFWLAQMLFFILTSLLMGYSYLR